MNATIARRALALALSAALISVPVSISMAAAFGDGYDDDGTGGAAPSGDSPGDHSGDGYDNTPLTSPDIPTGDSPGHDPDTDGEDGNQTIPCSSTDPCAPGHT